MRIERLKRRNERRRGQGMLEFALAIPVFLLLLLGIIEFGRMFLMYTSLFAAAREGARYGAAVETLCDHPGLESAARRVGFFAGDMRIAIQYDNGYGEVKNCPAQNLKLGDRIHVTTDITFRSITGIIPEVPLRSVARRTIIKKAEVEWELEPTSVKAGAIPPTISPHDPDNTPEEEPTPTNTPIPPAQECMDDWGVEEAESQIVEYYILKFTNTTGVSQKITQLTVTWDTSGGRELISIDYFPPNEDEFQNVWSGSDPSGNYTWIPNPPLDIVLVGNHYIRFEFTKSEKVISITININNNGENCSLIYP